MIGPVTIRVTGDGVYCASCSICNKPQCALCGWISVGKMIIAEMCRGCAEKA